MVNYRKIFEEHFKILLTNEDIIHHINLDRKNNDITNLWITDIRTHVKIHKSAYKIMAKLLQKSIKNNIVIFDNGVYKFKSRRYGNSLSVEDDVLIEE